MIPSPIRYLVLCAALAACTDNGSKTVKVNEALPDLPLPPSPSFVDRSAGPDALQITVRSPASKEEIAAYYREVFKIGGWRLVNDAKDAEGATVLFAQRNGPPLWVRIQSAADGNGTLVQLSGAVVSKADSAGAKAAS